MLTACDVRLLREKVHCVLEYFGINHSLYMVAVCCRRTLQ